MSSRSTHPRSRRQSLWAVTGAALAVLLLQVAFSPPARADWLSDLLGGTTTSTAPGGTTTTTQNSLCWLFNTCATTTTKAPTTTTTAPTTTTTAAPLTCGGVPTLPKAGGGTWTCSFDDEFTATTLDRTKWFPQPTDGSGFSSGGQDCYVDSPNNVSVSGGTLVLTSRKEAAPFTCRANASTSWQTQVTSGSVSTYGGRFSQAYGRFEVRAKVTGAKVKGLQESFWLWPDNPTKFGGWPLSGEIDIAEIYHQYPDRAIPFIHYNNPYDPNVTNNYCMINDIAQFHTYVAEWTPTSIKIIYDGVTCLEDAWAPAAPQTGRQPFDQPFIIALTQALGISTNAYDPATTPLPASTLVDYVRVYK